MLFLFNSILVKKTLIISDLHIGFEEELNTKGVLIPRSTELLESLKNLLESVKDKIDTIVLNGDIKHQFGKINEQEWRDTLRVIDLATKYGKVIIIKGNHDKILKPVAKKRDITLVDMYQIEDVLVLHGDKIKRIPSKIKTIIIGHEHCAVTLSDGATTEKFKCFLKGKYNGKELIVMPSFNPYTIGNDVLQDKILSPYLKQDISRFHVLIYDKELLDFGMVKSLHCLH